MNELLNEEATWLLWWLIFTISLIVTGIFLSLFSALGFEVCHHTQLFILILCVWVFCLHVPHMYPVLSEARRGHWISWE